jgi:hypothetical protein
MRHTSKLVLASLVLAVPAGAEPCEVAIARAPAEVRAAIADALAAEPHCRVALELRVVPTEGGYYLLARDLHGHTRERIVPDSASAATLVASWAADDELDGDRGSIAPAARPPLPSAPEVLAPPGEQVDVAPASPQPARAPFVGVYGTVGPHGHGIRGEIDLLRRGHWTLGAALAGVTETDFVSYSSYGSPAMTTLSGTDFELFGYISYERDLGQAWHLRGTAGGGVAIVQATVAVPADLSLPAESGFLQSDAGGTGAYPLVDASLAIDADVGHGFSLVAGVVFQTFVSTPSLLVSDGQGDTSSVQFSHSASWSLLGGLRYAL